MQRDARAVVTAGPEEFVRGIIALRYTPMCVCKLQIQWALQYGQPAETRQTRRLRTSTCVTVTVVIGLCRYDVSGAIAAGSAVAWVFGVRDASGEYVPRPLHLSKVW
jgi:hypothetical protein